MTWSGVLPQVINDGKITGLQLQKKKQSNTKTQFFVSLVIGMMIFAGWKMPVSGVSDSGMSEVTWQQSNQNPSINKGKGLSLAREIYWYIHSGIHDAKINVPHEGDLLHKIS